ncbi:MAG: response regulator transcription factor [Actinobacteria bacterium]|nr:response regulator transcription factor [Actinomycetota bacterium]
MKDGQLAQVLKFVVLEDHPLVRSAIIRDVLQRLGKVQVLYEGASLAEALDTARTTDVDCAVLDLDLGDGTNPADNVRALVDAGVPVLVISALADPMVVRESMSAGALAYVSKQADADVMQEAIQSTLAGKPFMSPDIALAIISDLQAEVKLSDQERLALSLYASGLKMTTVARRMDVSVTTAQEYIKRVRAKYTKAGQAVSTKTDLYRIAKKRGLITDD